MQPPRSSVRNSPLLSDSSGYRAQIGQCRSSARGVQERLKKKVKGLFIVERALSLSS